MPSETAGKPWQHTGSRRSLGIAFNAALRSSARHRSPPSRAASPLRHGAGRGPLIFVRKGSGAGDGSGFAGRRAGARCAPRPWPRFSRPTFRIRRLPHSLSLAPDRSTRRRAGARPPSSLSMAAPSRILSESGSSPRPCARTRRSHGQSRSGLSGCEDPGRRPLRDRAIVRRTPRPERTRGPRAASPPLDRIVPAPCRDRTSTAACHGGACSGCAGRRARLPPHRGLDSLGHLLQPPVAALAVARAAHLDSASRWHASAIVPVDGCAVHDFLREQVIALPIRMCTRQPWSITKRPVSMRRIRPPCSRRSRDRPQSASVPYGLAVIARLRRRSTASSRSHARAGPRPGHVTAAPAPAAPVAAPAFLRTVASILSATSCFLDHDHARGGRLASASRWRASALARTIPRQHARRPSPAPGTSSRHRAGARPPSASPTSRSKIQARASAPRPSRARQRLRRPRRTCQCTSAATAVARCRQRHAHQ